MTKTFKASSFPQRLSSMLGADIHRIKHTPAFFVMALIAFLMPILILVMTTMVGGADANGADSMPMFTNMFQIVASDSASYMNAMSAMGGMMGGTGAASADAGAMDMGAMMNMNLMYFMAAVFTCLFVAEDFRSGYAKNLFTVRGRKTEYVVSKTLVGALAGAFFLLVFFLGAGVGGSVAGLSTDPGAGGVMGVICCLLAKIFLMAVFTAIFVLMSVIGKHRTWMSVLLSLFAGMLLFMMIPMMTPLDSTFMHVGMCLAGGLIFAADVGVVSSLILKNTSLV